ncbi:MAG: phosphate ABC transporter substrate-binding protein [Candidatus Geothermincolia bacterium]
MRKSSWIAGVAIIAMLTVVLAAAGCGESGVGLSGNLSISGSTTVLPLGSEAASRFMDANPDAEVNVQGGGSSVGVTQVSQGVVDIGMSSRELKAEEQALGLVDHRIALDVIVLIANKNVGVDELSAQQVKDIFTGRVTNWSQVGGNDAPVVVVVRDQASGTREMFDEKALDKGQPTTSALESNSNGILRQTVASTANAIGYVSLGYLDGSVNALRYDGVEASKDSAVDGSYPLSRYLHLFTQGEATELARSFIDYVLSDSFQDEVVGIEYVKASEF